MSAATATKKSAPPSSTTVAVRPIDQCRSFLENHEVMNNLRAACSQAIKPHQVAAACLAAALKSPDLQQCFTSQIGRSSVMNSLLTAAQLGLLVNGRDAHLVPFKTKVADQTVMTCQLIPDFKGKIQLAYNHPKVLSIYYSPVYKKDRFVYKMGLNRTLDHEPYEGEDDPGPIIAAYAVCEMEGGAKDFEVVRAREAKKARASSRGANNPNSPWNTNEADMWCKTAVHRLLKRIPQSNELKAVSAHEDEAEREIEATTPAIDVPSAKVPQPTEGSGDSIPVEGNASSGATTPQQKLAELVIGAKKSFDDFHKAAVDAGWISDATEYGSFDELPVDVCEKLIASPKVLVAQLNG